MAQNTSDLGPSLIAQAQTILEAATSLQQQLESASLPQPSFSPTGRRNWHDVSHLPALLETRLRLLDSVQSMLDLVTGPLDTLLQLTTVTTTKIEVLRTLDKLKIAEHVPIEGDIRVVELADKLKLDQDVLDRHLRCAYMMGIFKEPREGYIAHTGTSAAMPSFSPYTQLRLSQTFLKGTFHVAESMKIGGTDGKAPSPIELADKERGGRGFWKQINDDHPDGTGMEKFSAGMRVIAEAYSGGSYVSFLQAFDWEGLGTGTVVDVGGGNGHVAAHLAKHFPDLDFVVQDLESNVETGRQTIQQHGVENRVKYQTQDFFEPQPADLRPTAYILSRVLHDWQDNECVRILKPLLPAMEKYGTKLLIIERILPDKVGELPRSKEWHLRTTDILMYTLSGAKERDLKSFEILLKKADERLRVVDCRQPVNTILGSLQVELKN